MRPRISVWVSFDHPYSLFHRQSRPPWTCRQCLQQRQQLPLRSPLRQQRANYATQFRRTVGGKKRARRALQYATAGGTLGVAALAFSDDIKHGYIAAERTGRVMTTLAVCINE